MPQNTHTCAAACLLAAFRCVFNNAGWVDFAAIRPLAERCCNAIRSHAVTMHSLQDAALDALCTNCGGRAAAASAGQTAAAGSCTAAPEALLCDPGLAVDQVRALLKQPGQPAAPSCFFKRGVRQDGACPAECSEKDFGAAGSNCCTIDPCPDGGSSSDLYDTAFPWHSTACTTLPFPDIPLHVRHCLSLTFHCLFLSLTLLPVPWLSLTLPLPVPCLSSTFHCISSTCHCPLSLPFRWFFGVLLEVLSATLGALSKQMIR